MSFNFIVHTDSYAGNFERQLCAFITGKVTEGCEFQVEDFYKNYLANTPEHIKKYFDDNVLFLREDEDKSWTSPCDVAPTPGYGNNGYGVTKLIIGKSDANIFKYPAYHSVAIHLKSKPSREIFEFMEKRAKEAPQFKAKDWVFDQIKRVKIKNCVIEEDVYPYDYD